MKILLIGGETRGGLTMSYYRAFTDLGHKVKILNEQKEYRKGFLRRNRYTHRLLWRVLTSSFQKKMINETANEKPDLILVFKGWLIKPETLLAVKRYSPNVALFNFNGDNPFNTWHHGNSNNWIRKSISLYDIYFIWGRFLMKPILEAGAKRVEYLPCGYDPILHYPVQMNKEKEAFFGSDISFIGSWDREREQQLEPLLKYNLKIWGNAWERASRKVQVKWQKRKVIGEDFAKVCCASKINLNFHRKQTGPASNMRTFEIPACGGFELSVRTEAQKEFFKEGKEMEFFSTSKELVQKIDFYLRHEKLRGQIAKAGYKRVVESDYTYTARARQILKVYNEQRADII